MFIKVHVTYKAVADVFGHEYVKPRRCNQKFKIKWKKNFQVAQKLLL